MPYHNEDIKSKDEINILPMIDVIFAILSFLIVSTLHLSKINTIPVDLPKASSSIKQDKKFITVSIDRKGILFINKQKILLEDLNLQIVNLMNNDQKIVVVHADKDVSHGNVINVLDLLRGIEGLKIAISTKMKVGSF